MLESEWIHTSTGNRYILTCVPNLHADWDRKVEYPTLAVYRGEDGRLWARRMEDFLENFKEEEV